MLQKTQFYHRGTLTAEDLNTMDDYMEEAVRDIGRTVNELYEDWICEEESEDNDSYFLDKVIVSNGDTTSFADYTNPSRAAVITPTYPYNGTNWDVVWTWATGDILYFGYEYQFEALRFHLNPVSDDGVPASVVPDWEYWDGSDWVDLTETDNTTGFSISNQTVTWTAPNDWEMISLDKAHEETLFGYNILSMDSVYRWWVRVKVGNANLFGITQVRRNTNRGNELEVIPTDPVSMAVVVRPGVAFIDGWLAYVPYDNVLSIEAPAANSRYAAVQLTLEGELIVEYGDSGVTPIQRNARVDAIKLADILSTSTDTDVGGVGGGGVSSIITDQRLYD